MCSITRLSVVFLSASIANQWLEELNSSLRELPFWMRKSMSCLQIPFILCVNEFGDIFQALASCTHKSWSIHLERIFITKMTGLREIKFSHRFWYMQTLPLLACICHSAAGVIQVWLSQQYSSKWEVGHSPDVPSACCLHNHLHRTCASWCWWAPSAWSCRPAWGYSKHHSVVGGIAC